MEDCHVIKRHAAAWPERRALVCGPTRYDDWDLLKSVLRQCEPTTIVHGHSAGVDHLASMYAQMFNLNEMRFPADWRRHGLDAPLIRNARMFVHSDPDIVLSFPGGPNCNDIVRRAHVARVPVVEIDGDWMTAMRRHSSETIRARA